MRPRFLLGFIMAAIGAAVVLGMAVSVFRPNTDRDTTPPTEPDVASPGASAPRTPTPTTGTPAADPAVPIDLPTPPPGLDRALAADLRRALEGQGFRITGLTIVDTRATGGIRRAEIVYRTATDGSLEALRPEIVRILGPSVNPKLALDQIAVRPVRASGTAVATVTVTVVDADRWLKAQMSDADFYRRWTVRRP
jgi:hypothetical protein